MARGLTAESIDDAIYKNRLMFVGWQIARYGRDAAKRSLDKEIADLQRARDELFPAKGEHHD